MNRAGPPEPEARATTIGYCEAATTLFEAVGLGDKVDRGFVALTNGASVAGLLDACASLPYWDREAAFV